MSDHGIIDETLRHQGRKEGRIYSVIFHIIGFFVVVFFAFLDRIAYAFTFLSLPRTQQASILQDRQHSEPRTKNQEPASWLKCQPIQFFFSSSRHSVPGR
jgi:hypothetical protein